jgi:hypothetical protein
MKINLSPRIFLLLFFTFSLFSHYEIIAQTSVLTQHNNLSRTGWNNNETILNTKNVKPGTFGKLFTRSVDDELYAQLLIKTNVPIPAKGNKNIVFAATVSNSVYAFDADFANVAQPYWKVNLTQPGMRPLMHTDMTNACGGNYNDFSGNIGIVGTPVIDSITNTLYVVARSCETNGTGYVQYLHALDITTGNERPYSPKLITAQVAGTGIGNVGGKVMFDPQKNNQRSGLLLLNGKIYICFSSHCDWGPYHGWILGYDKTTLQQTTVYTDTPDGHNGGIWMSGSAPSADDAGNIYVATGNGTAGANGNMSDLRNRSESALKLFPSGSGFTIKSFFTPNNYPTLEAGDLDFGSAEMMLIPNTNQVLTACKDGKMYLLNRDNLGGYNATMNNVVQTIDLGVNAHLRSSFAYYKGAKEEFAYTWSENSILKAIPYSHTLNKFDVAGIINSGVQGPVGNNGAFMSVSSNGSVDSTAILWTSFAANGDANQSVRPGILHAFDAIDVTKELWNSSDLQGDEPGSYAKFNCPTIANGKVYLATFSKQFIVYGLTGNISDSCNSTDLALNKPAFASSIQSSAYPASAAFDGSQVTRWASLGQSDPQYIYVDLGQRYDLCRIVLRWETALGKNFTIDVSDDAITWTTISTITNNILYINYMNINGRGRYVRMKGTARGTNFGYSLYAFEVYGKSVPKCPVPVGLTTSDIYENSAIIHWAGNNASHFNIQYKSVEAAGWTTIRSDTNLVILNNLDCGTDYLYRVQSLCGQTDTSVYSSSSAFSQLACGSNCDPLPTRWSTVDVGNTAVAGSACYTPDIFTLKGSGDDIGNKADAFRFAFKTLVGDGEFNGRVVLIDQSNPSNKCGIMIRETLSPESKYAFITLTSGSGAIFQYRPSTGGSSNAVTITTDISPPYYVKLIKKGSVYAASISPDGINYTPAGSAVDAGFGNGMPVYAGLAITSHDNTVLSTGMVDKFVFTGVSPVKLLSFTAALNFSHKVDLEWSTSKEMNAGYFIIERSGADYRFKPIGLVKGISNSEPVTTYHAVDNAPLNNINFYRLKIIDVNGNISYSAYVMVRLDNSKAPLVYPNPAKTFINIAQGSDAVKFVTIYDISGRAIIRFNNKNTSSIAQMSIAGLLTGTYIVEINTATTLYRDKLLVQ